MSTTPILGSTNNNGSTDTLGDAVAASSASNGIGTGSAADVSNMFTTLLVAQIRNQDPTQPSDPTAFVNQLTQLSQMQALQKLADQGSSGNSTLLSLQMLALGGQVGSVVQAKVDSLTLDKQAVSTHFTLQSNAADAKLVLTGDDGSVKRIDIGTVSAGDNSYSLNPAAFGVMPGHYAIHVETASNESAGIEISAPIASVKVDASGSPVLSLGTLAQVDPSALTQFDGRPASGN